MILDKINSPADIKALSLAEMNVLSNETRTVLLNKLSVKGGHIGPNLGIVEATIAMHYVFNSPIDKIVFDVSHQSYPHKIYTGRKEAFINPEKYNDVSGYSEPSESEHDHFIIGHTSTSISLACGLAKGRDLQGGTWNVIAVIGDGSLSGGEAMEGLNVAAELNSNLIIIVNDNQMSIAENHGGLYKNLQELRESNGKCECNIFKSFNLDYIYVDRGNDIESLITAFKQAKDVTRPIVIHINTIKGKGYSFAEADKETWHWGIPFDIESGKSLNNDDNDDYHSLTAKFLLDEMKKDDRLVAITAGTPAVMGFGLRERAKAGKQFVDVGIAEETAVAMASGIAKAGGKPVWGVYSSFIQRTYDQLSQDLCINNNPATILVFMGSLVGMNDVTHLGFFDIPLISNIPNMIYLAPTCKDEYIAMLKWSLDYTGHPVAIRVPVARITESDNTFDTDYSNLNKYRITKKGYKVAILGLGAFHALAESTATLLKEKTGIEATIINPRFITGVDAEMLEQLKHDHSLIVTLEDGVLDGGFGEKIARYYGADNIKVLNFGGVKEFADRYNRKEYLSKNGLTKEQIAADIISHIL